MNLKHFKTEFRFTDYKYDPWGCAMEAFFECAGHMNKRGLYIPVEWRYSPSIIGNGIDIESYWYEFFVRCSNKQLLYIGNFLNKYCDYLKKKGRGY